MKSIVKTQFMQEYVQIIDTMYHLGWDERNGGNVSYLLKSEELKPYLHKLKPEREIKLNIDAKYLSGKYFLVTGSGKHFRNVKTDPESNCGIIEISKDGSSASILWGLKHGAVPTSELDSHLLSHIERLKLDRNHRVIIHTHATNLVSMTLVHNLDEADFSKTLWKMCSECIIVFPEGVGIIPWMIPGNKEIGLETAKKMTQSRIIIWPMHGVFGSGNSLDDAFGLIETAEKAAEIYLKIAGLEIKQMITEQQLLGIAEAFKVKPAFPLKKQEG